MPRQRCAVFRSPCLCPAVHSAALCCNACATCPPAHRLLTPDSSSPSPRRIPALVRTLGMAEQEFSSSHTDQIPSSGLEGVSGMALSLGIFWDSSLGMFWDLSLGLFQDSSLGMFQDYSFYKGSSLGIFQHSSLGIFQYPSLGKFLHSSLMMSQDSRIPILGCSKIPILKYSRIPVLGSRIPNSSLLES